MLVDDTALMQSSKRTQCLLSSELKPACDWFPSNKVTNNLAKCGAMCFRRGKLEKKRTRSAHLDHRASCKYFRVHLKKKLNFLQHIDSVVKILKNFCGLIYWIRVFYPRKSLLVFFNFFAK